MPWRGPEHENDFPSLGWALLEWWADYLPSPRNPGDPLIFTDDQARWLVEWYRLDPRTGKFVHRRRYARRSKGYGKSPGEAAVCIAELAGPVRFDGWDSAGEPVGRPWGTMGDPLPWVQIAAVSEDQTDNTYSVVHYFLTENDGHAADELKIDAGLTRCFLRDKPGAKLEPVTAAAGSREGQPITYGCLDETHLWTPRNGGVRLAKTIRRNVAKMGGRSSETTNAFVPGEGSVAEASFKAHEKGAPGILADQREAPRELDGVKVTLDAPDAILERALDYAYSDSWWVDRRRLVDEIRDPDTSWDDACRFFFNWNQKGGGAAVDAQRWDVDLVDPQDVPDGTRIGLGFDGSISNDSTFLVGCTAAGYTFLIGAWERPRHDDGRPVKDWRVPRLEVHQAVAAAFERYDVGRMLCDPPKWETEVDTWAETYRLEKGSTAEERERVVRLPTFSETRFARLVDRWLTAIAEGSLSHDGDDRLRAHVLAAHKKKIKPSAEDDDGRTLYVLVKGDDGRKIDGAIAAVLAHEAAMTMPEKQVELVGAFVDLDDY